MSCHARARCNQTGSGDTRIRELHLLRRELAGLIADCDANAEGGACPVIRRLASQVTVDARPSRLRVRAGGSTNAR